MSESSWSIATANDARPRPQPRPTERLIISSRLRLAGHQGADDLSACLAGAHVAVVLPALTRIVRVAVTILAGDRRLELVVDIVDIGVVERFGRGTGVVHAD